MELGWVRGQVRELMETSLTGRVLECHTIQCVSHSSVNALMAISLAPACVLLPPMNPVT